MFYVHEIVYNSEYIMIYNKLKRKTTLPNQENINAYKYNSFQTYDEAMKDLFPLLF